MSDKGAALSPDGVYRYILWRSWPTMFHEAVVVFVGLNPSTADADKDDNTIRKCRGFAKKWGHSRMLMVNLFAFRATKPADMMKAKDPVGPENDQYLWFIRKNSPGALIVAAWGAEGGYMNRDREVMEIFPGMLCLGKTKEGHPRHPLYVPYETSLVPLED